MKTTAAILILFFASSFGCFVCNPAAATKAFINNPGRVIKKDLDNVVHTIEDAAKIVGFSELHRLTKRDITIYNDADQPIEFQISKSGDYGSNDWYKLAANGGVVGQ